MAIVAGDLLYRYTGAASHNAAQADPNASLGGFRAVTNVTAGDNNLFADVTGAEAAAGSTKYRAVGFFNNHGSLPLTAGVCWISSDTGNGEDDISIDTEAPTTPDETTGLVQTIADEDTAPSGRVWSDGTTKGTGRNFPGAGQDVAAGDWFAIWIRRIIAAAASAAAAESVTIRSEGDTAA